MAKIEIIPDTENETGNWETSPFSIDDGMSRKDKDARIVEYLSSTNKRLNALKVEFSQAKQDNAREANRNVEILAIFVTLFTFISIETQILRSGIDFLTAIGFSIVLFSGLTFFLFTLKFLVKDEWSKFGQYLISLIFTLILMVAGLFCVWKGQISFYGDLNAKFYNKTEIDQMIAQSLSDFKKCIQTNGGYWACLK